MIGSTVSHYRITGKLGEGGMGIVYKAEDTRLERTVALKFLPEETASGGRERFLREARAAAALHHPNICPIHEIDEAEGRLFFAMAFVEGSTIGELTTPGPLPLNFALEIAIQVANGLETAHQAGIVHRDIKANNIVVDKQGSACILDFGLALRGDAERLTRPGGLVGTPAYMSPEQAQGLAIDHRTDIWSLGVVLFQMLTGRLPFQRDGDLSVLYAIVNQPHPAVEQLRVDAPDSLARAIAKCLAKEPRERWQTAAQLSAALRGVLAGSRDETIAIGHTAIATPTPQPRRRWVIAAPLAAAAAIAAAGAALYWPLKASLPSEKQIAVLPLTLAGDDPAMRTLADGLTETITSKLTQIEEFQGKMMVVPSSEIHARKIVSAEDARRIYGATLAITGSGQRWGDRIEFTLNLVDSQKLKQIGSRTIEFVASNPIAFRDKAVDAVVQLLQLQLTESSSGAVATGETASAGAYSNYLEAKGYLARYDIPGNIDRAFPLLQSAVAQDPRYALAYAALGEAYAWKAVLTRETHWGERAIENGQKAVELSPKLVAARVKLADILTERGRHDEAIVQATVALDIAKGSAEAYRSLARAQEAAMQFAKAEHSYREAVKLRPGDWYGHLLLGIFLANRGRTEDGRRSLEEARKLTPDNDVITRNLGAIALRQGRFADAEKLLKSAARFDRSARIHSSLGIAYYYQRKFREAEAALEKAIQIDALPYGFHGNLATVQRWIPGKEDQARQAFRRAIDLGEKSLRLNPNESNTHANLALYHARLGERAEALRELAAIPAPAEGPCLDRIALTHLVLGDRAAAVDAVKRMAAGGQSIRMLRGDPDLDSLWKEPVLAGLVAKGTEAR